jgi:uncharacterized protein
MKIRIFIALFLLFAAPLQAQELAGILTTSGRGQVAVAPDMVTVTVGVESEAETAEAALKANNAAMQAVVALLDSSGVAARDMQTSQFSISPVWDNSKASLGLPLSVRGFVASNLLSVKVRRIDGLGAVLDALVSSGANRIQGVRFGVADPTPHLDQARRLAVAEAIRKARLYADAAGVTLGALLAIDDTGGARVAAPFALEARVMASAVPIAEGELLISAEVTLRFALE